MVMMVVMVVCVGGDRAVCVRAHVCVREVAYVRVRAQCDGSLTTLFVNARASWCRAGGVVRVLAGWQDGRVRIARQDGPYLGCRVGRATSRAQGAY